MEEFGITVIDEEIDVFCSRKSFFEADVALPMAVADAFLLQRVEEPPDGRFARNRRQRVRLNR